MNENTIQPKDKPVYIPVFVNDKPHKQTNGDRIRAMTDEELAVFLSQTEEHLFTGNLWSIGTWNEWLKKEVEDDKA